MTMSAVKMGWILCMFDLPVATKKQRKIATGFRKSLLDDGYIMVQFSVYARPCVNYEHLDKHTRRLEGIVPNAGNVRVLFLTDSQWKRGMTVVGEDYQRSRWDENVGMPEQAEFWE